VDCRRGHVEQAGRAATDAELAACLARGLFETRGALAKATASLDASHRNEGELLLQLVSAEGEVDRLRKVADHLGSGSVLNPAAGADAEFIAIFAAGQLTRLWQRGSSLLSWAAVQEIKDDIAAAEAAKGVDRG